MKGDKRKTARGILFVLIWELLAFGISGIMPLFMLPEINYFAKFLGLSLIFHGYTLHKGIQELKKAHYSPELTREDLGE